MEHLTICLNLDTGAPTQFSNFNFKSFTTFQGLTLAAGKSGIHLLNTGDLDVASPIAAWFETPTINMGDIKAKHLIKALLNLELKGIITLEITIDESRIDAYTLDNTLDSLTSRAASITLASKAIGANFSFKLSNQVGADFAVDSLYILQILMSQYAVSRNSHAAGRIKISMLDNMVSGESNG